MNSLLEVERISTIPCLKETPTMILGMDVSHGCPGQPDAPSIASVRTQSPKAEMIDLSGGGLMDMFSQTILAVMKFDNGIFCVTDSKVVNRITGEVTSQPKMDLLGDVVLMYSGNLYRYFLMKRYLDSLTRGRAVRNHTAMDAEEIAVEAQESLIRTNSLGDCIGRSLQVFVCRFNRDLRLPKIFVVNSRWNNIHACSYRVGGSGVNAITRGLHFDFPSPPYFL